MIGSRECHDWAQAERCHDVLPRGQNLGREQPGDLGRPPSGQGLQESASFNVQERRRCDCAVAAIARIVSAMQSLTLELEIVV
jgi:hypothetical protein